MKTLKNILPGIAFFSLAVTASAGIGFEDLGFAAGFNYENGEHLSGTETVTNDPFGASTGSLVTKNSVFTSSELGVQGSFANTYNEKYDAPDGTGNLEYTYWSQWAYSKDTDTVTSGSGNQYSAITGSGSRGSANYGVSFGDTIIDFSTTQDLSGRGFDLTNTTYVHNSMRDGGSFAKQFAAGDFFFLTVEGFRCGTSAGTLDFYLADFTSADAADHYILDTWAFADLSTLGTVDSLAFDLSSSDVGDFGMNTPDYFAIDNVGAVPEPATYALLAGLIGLASVVVRRR